MEVKNDTSPSMFPLSTNAYSQNHLSGAYAEYVAISTRMLLPKPQNLSWEEAAGIPETWFTAIQAMYLVAGFESGKSILWHAAASSVSAAGIQLSRADGASAIHTTASSQEKLDFAKGLGATDFYNYRTQDWSEALQAQTAGQGVDIIIDFVGGPYFEGNLKAAAKDGHIVTLAALGGYEIPGAASVLPFIVKRLRFEGSTLRARSEEYQGRIRDLLASKLGKFSSGEFKTNVDRTFPMEDIQQAHALLESSDRIGKMICTTGL
jgi:NADPH:quinone reductase-like Zn-dependent oxidoreductase